MNPHKYDAIGQLAAQLVNLMLEHRAAPQASAIAMGLACKTLLSMEAGEGLTADKIAVVRARVLQWVGQGFDTPVMALLDDDGSDEVEFTGTVPLS